MEQINTEISKKEKKKKKQIFQLAKNDEIGKLLLRWSCAEFQCEITWNENLVTKSLREIMNYLINTEVFVIENVRKDALGELGKLLVLYRDKDTLLQRQKIEKSWERIIVSIL